MGLTPPGDVGEAEGLGASHTATKDLVGHWTSTTVKVRPRGVRPVLARPRRTAARAASRLVAVPIPPSYLCSCPTRSRVQLPRHSHSHAHSHAHSHSHSHSHCHPGRSLEPSRGRAPSPRPCVRRSSSHLQACARTTLPERSLSEVESEAGRDRRSGDGGDLGAATRLGSTRPTATKTSRSVPSDGRSEI